MGLTLDKFLSLGEDEKKFHPLAVEHYTQFLADIRQDVPLDAITEDDVREFLPGAAYWQYEQAIKSLQDWLPRCRLDNSQPTLSVYPSSFPVFGTWGFKSLLVKVYKLKRQHEMLLAAQKEREERAWQAKIDQEARYKRAELEHSQFLNEIINIIKEFKKQLAKKKKPKYACPQWLVGYKPDLWCGLVLPTQQQIEEWARPRILQRVPSALGEFVSWDISWEVHAEPHARYEVLGIPCLDWWFTLLIIVEVHLRLIEKKFSKDFQGYRYEMKVDAEELGYLYLGPALGGDREGFSTPVALLALLTEGKFEGQGIAVLMHEAGCTVFTVEGFHDYHVEIHKSFRTFIRDTAKNQSLAKGLLAKGLLDEEGANLVDAKWHEPLPVSAMAAGAGSLDRSSVVTKLVEIGWTEADAKKAVETTAFPVNITAEEMLKIILEKLY